MNNPASIPTAHIDQAINAFVSKQRSFTTIDILRESGLDGYHCDTGVPVGRSPNANFGRRVAAACARKGISVLNRRLNAIDDNGNKTTTTQWAAHRDRRQ